MAVTLFLTKKPFKYWIIIIKTIITGKTNKSDGLYNIPLTTPIQPSQGDNPIVQMNKTNKYLAIESIANLLKQEIPCAPPVIPNPDPTPTPEQTIPVPDKYPMNVPTIIPTMPTVPVQVQSIYTVSPSMPLVQVQRVPLK